VGSQIYDINTIIEYEMELGGTEEGEAQERGRHRIEEEAQRR